MFIAVIFIARKKNLPRIAKYPVYFVTYSNLIQFATTSSFWSELCSVLINGFIYMLRTWRKCLHLTNLSSFTGILSMTFSCVFGKYVFIPLHLFYLTGSSVGKRWSEYCHYQERVTTGTDEHISAGAFTLYNCLC